MRGRMPSVESVAKHVVNSRVKPDVYKDGPWEEWLNHFQLCAEINQWNEDQCCQQLAVSLRRRAQTVYITLSTEDNRATKNCWQPYKQNNDTNWHFVRENEKKEKNLWIWRPTSGD